MNQTVIYDKDSTQSPIFNAWSTHDNKIERGTYVSSKAYPQRVLNAEEPNVNILESERRIEMINKRATILKTFVLVIMTLVSFGLLLHQGSICISK